MKYFVIFLVVLLLSACGEYSVIKSDTTPTPIKVKAVKVITDPLHEDFIQYKIKPKNYSTLYVVEFIPKNNPDLFCIAFHSNDSSPNCYPRKDKTDGK